MQPGQPDLDAVCEGLERLVETLSGGSPQAVEESLEGLASPIERLRVWKETAVPERRPETALAVRRLRELLARAETMLGRGEQIRYVLCGILSLLYEAHAGSKYSASGAASLPHAPRMVAEG